VEIQVELDELNEEEEMESAWQDDLMEQDGVFAMETGMEMDATGSAPVGMTASDSGNEEDDEEDMREEDEYLSDEDYPSEEEDPEAFGEEPAGLTIAEIRKLTDKLDSMMQLVFQHLAARRERDPQAAVADFYLLLETFDHSILRTFKSRYTQFLLFYQASVSPDLTDIFLGHLIEKLCDTTQPTVIRLAAASYVSSFVARAAYISKESVRSAMAVLVGWAHLYVDQNEVNCAWPDSERYSVFYAIVQAILYIFCFRWRDLRLDMDDEHDANLSNRLHLTVPTVDTEAPSSVEGGAKVNTQEEWCLGLAGLQRIITSRFNPLKVSVSLG
jgi:RNA polymerase I-specific transcription initiation factor RRN3